jgi:hypothetical protein
MPGQGSLFSSISLSTAEIATLIAIIGGLLAAAAGEDVAHASGTVNVCGTRAMRGMPTIRFRFSHLTHDRPVTNLG